MIDGERKTILVVDDEPLIRELVVFELQSLNFETLEASNGKEAFIILRDRKVDLVISDIRMPGGDGTELLERIKNELQDPPPLIFITGFGDSTQRATPIYPLVGLLNKPFSLEQFDDLVLKAMAI